MVLNDKGQWDWSQTSKDERAEHITHLDQLFALRLRWNKVVAEYNAIVTPKRRNLGRLLNASRTQQADVLAKRKAGQSLRDIAEDTSLTLQTVRTIIDKADGIDRATLARLERIAPDKLAKLKEARIRRLLRARDALPDKINESVERTGELLQRAKGYCPCSARQGAQVCGVVMPGWRRRGIASALLRPLI